MKLLMKIFWKFVCIIFVLQYVSGGNTNCTERAAKISVNMTECCDFPEFFDMKVFNETYEKVMHDAKAPPGSPLFDCLIEQTLFKKLKFVDEKGNIDAAKINSTIIEAVKDPNWKNTLLNAIPKCLTESQKYADKYQSMTKIPKDTCDFKYDAIGDCMDIAGFIQCPESSWIKSLPNANASTVTACEAMKTFIKDCHADVGAMDEFLDHQKD